MKSIKGIAAGILALVCVVSVILPSETFAAAFDSSTYLASGTSSSTAAGIVDKEQEVEDTKEDIEEAESSKEALESAKIELEGYLGELNDTLQQLGNEISALEQEISGTEEDIAAIQADLEIAKADENEQYEDMKKRIQYMYEEGNFSLYAALMTGNSITDIISRSEYISKISKYDRAMLEKYSETKENIAENEAALNEQQASLKELQEEMTAKQADLETTVATVQAEIAEHTEEIAAAEVQIAEYEQLLAAQEQELSSLEAIAAAEAAATSSEEVTLAAQQAQAIVSSLNTLMSDLGLSTKTVTATYGEAYSYTDTDLVLLATLIYVEAGGESFEGQCAVGAVVMNRVKSSEFPNSIIGVIYDPGQFTPVTTGRYALALAQNEATASCYEAAQKALNGYNNIGSYLYFRTPNGRVSGLQIGGHIFHDGSTGF